MTPTRLLMLLCASASLCSPAVAQSREELVRGDKLKVELAGFWIYNDLPLAFAEAEQTGKPIVVVLRCVPCHECVKLDDELVETDPVIRPLLEQFVCARQVATNGLDLDLFQFDTDQSFVVFFLNADKTIYGRFGTRSHRTEWRDDVSLAGLAKALQGALDLHKRYDAVKSSLAGKRGEPLEFPTPEQFPSLKDEYTSSLNYAGDVVKGCIHCHMIGDAQRDFHWHTEGAIPDKVLWPFPHPRTIGLTFDPDEMATVTNVATDSPAAAAGLRAGDVISALNGQPILSIADVQWVLHNVDPAGGRVAVHVQRAEGPAKVELGFAEGWRRKGDLSWRVSSWGLRRMALGGLQLGPLPDEEREKLDLPTEAMALKVKSAGMYGPHATAYGLGIRQGDIVVEFDGRQDFESEGDVLAHVVTTRRPGDEVSLKVLRGEAATTYRLPIQP